MPTPRLGRERLLYGGRGGEGELSGAGIISGEERGGGGRWPFSQYKVTVPWGKESIAAAVGRRRKGAEERRGRRRRP